MTPDAILPRYGAPLVSRDHTVFVLTLAICRYHQRHVVVGTALLRVTVRSSHRIKLISLLNMKGAVHNCWASSAASITCRGTSGDSMSGPHFQFVTQQRNDGFIVGRGVEHGATSSMARPFSRTLSQLTVVHVVRPRSALPVVAMCLMIWHPWGISLLRRGASLARSFIL